MFANSRSAWIRQKHTLAGNDAIYIELQRARFEVYFCNIHHACLGMLATGEGIMRSALVLTEKAYQVAREVLQPITPELPTDKALEVELNPDGRGLFITKISDWPPKIKVWGLHLYLTCVRGQDDGCFLALDCRQSDPAQFSRAYPWGKVIRGEWIIARTSDRSQYQAAGNNEAWAIVGQIPHSAARAHEFWQQWDRINEEQRERLDRLSSEEQCKFHDAVPLADQDLIAFALSDSRLGDKLTEGVTIQVQLTCGGEGSARWTPVGKVAEFDPDRGLLLVSPFRQDVRRLFETPNSAESAQGRAGSLRIDRSGDYAIVRRQKDALDRLRRLETANPRLSEFIPDCSGASVPEHVSHPPFPLFQRDLTQTQFTAVCGSLSAPDIYLIQGPPGTGKTTVISEIIHQVASAGQTVLICSQAHVAVDNVLQRVGSLPGVRAVRVGDSGRVEPDCEKYLLERAVSDWQARLLERANSNFLRREEARADPYLLRKRIAVLQSAIEPLRRLSECRKKKQLALRRTEETKRRLGQARTQEERSARVVHAIRRRVFDGRDVSVQDYELACRIMMVTGWTLGELRKNVACVLALRGDAGDRQRAVQAFEEVFGYRPTELAVQMLLERVEKVRVLCPSLPRLAGVLKDFEKLEGLARAEEDLRRDHEIVEELNSTYESVLSELKALEGAENAIWAPDSALTIFAREFGMDRDSITDEITTWARDELARLSELLSLGTLHDRTRDIVRDWMDSLKAYQPSLEQVYLDNTNVVAATCMGIAATSNNAFVDKEFDLVIIDESARCEPVELLVPMVRGKKIILVGDHKQLPPQRDHELERALEESGHMDSEAVNRLFSESLFQRLYESAPDSLRAFLDTQFRMNPEISGLVRGFYEKELRDGSTASSRDHGLPDRWPGHAFWVTTSGMTQNKETRRSKASTSYGNRADIGVIAAILEGLDESYSRLSPPPRKTVGVITGYAYQKQLLLDALITKRGKPWQYLDLEIDTIDAFQGREKNIVLVSLVRTNDQGRMGFVAHDPRVNVALSRAQELLIIVGDDDFIEKYRAWAGRLAATLDKLRRSGKLITGLSIVVR